MKYGGNATALYNCQTLFTAFLAMKSRDFYKLFGKSTDMD